MKIIDKNIDELIPYARNPRKNDDAVSGVAARRALTLEKADWVKDLYSSCKVKKIPFFFKQWGGLRPTSNGHLIAGSAIKQMPKFFD